MFCDFGRNDFSTFVLFVKEFQLFYEKVSRETMILEWVKQSKIQMFYMTFQRRNNSSMR